MAGNNLPAIFFLYNICEIPILLVKKDKNKECDFYVNGLIKYLIYQKKKLIIICRRYAAKMQ